MTDEHRPALHRYAVALLGVVLIALWAAPWFFWGGGIVDIEAAILIDHRLNSDSLLALAFDPRRNDWGTYQSRELSYLVDIIDAHFWGWLVALGVRWFVPLSNMLAMLACAGILVWRGRNAFPSLGLFVPLVCLVFLTDAHVFSSAALFYRSAKVMTTLSLLLLLLELVAATRTPPPGRAVLARLAGLGLLVTLFDRQGFFHLCCAAALFAVLLGGELLARRRGAPTDAPDEAPMGAGWILLSLVAAVLASTLVNLLLTPAMVWWLNGYWPDPSYQTTSLWEIVQQGSTWLVGFRRLGDHVALFFGGLPGWGVALAAAALLALACRAARGAARVRLLSLLAAGVVLAALLALMLGIMERRLASLSVLAEWQYFYYYLTLTPWLAVASLLSLRWLASRGPRVRAAAGACLVALALGNLLSVYRAGQDLGSFETMHSYFVQTQRMRNAPRSANVKTTVCKAEAAYDRTLTRVPAQGWCERYDLLYWRVVKRKD